MARDHSNEIKNDAVVEALCDRGASKEKAARIANSRANPQQRPSARGGKAGPCEHWIKRRLTEWARELDVVGRSKMTKDELIEALGSR